MLKIRWAAPSEFGTYRLCEQRRFRRACASAQSRQNLRCSLIQAVSQEEPSDRKPDAWTLWMAGHAQLKLVMTECSKTQIRLTRLRWYARKRIYHGCLVWIEKFIPRDHCLASKQWPSDGFFYPHLTPIKDSYNPLQHIFQDGTASLKHWRWQKVNEHAIG